VIAEAGVVPIAAERNEDDVVHHLVRNDIVGEGELPQRRAGGRPEFELDDEIDGRFAEGHVHHARGNGPRSAIGCADGDVLGDVGGEGVAVAGDYGGGVSEQRGAEGELELGERESELGGDAVGLEIEEDGRAGRVVGGEPPGAHEREQPDEERRRSGRMAQKLPP